MPSRDRTLIIIGGGEDRSGDKAILGEVARRVGAGKLVVTTVAVSDPAGLFEKYETAFRSLGVKHVFKLEVNERQEATESTTSNSMSSAKATASTSTPSNPSVCRSGRRKDCRRRCGNSTSYDRSEGRL